MAAFIKESENPLTLFSQWFAEAQDQGLFEPTAMTLATVDSEGMPSARIVLLKEHNQEGFCFFTNYESVKAQELSEMAKAALVFHWQKPQHRQVRVRGLVEKLTYEESDAYFQTRHRGSQLGAWASPQSRPIRSREALEKRVEDFEGKFEGQEKIPCPDYWGGYRLKPLSIEFWQAQEFRLHDRMKFTRQDLSHPWVAQRLAP